MNQCNDGGPVFPQEIDEECLYPDARVKFSGMTHRQWLAGMALSGLMQIKDRPKVDYLQRCKNISKIAYNMADAMIAYEEKENN